MSVLASLLKELPLCAKHGPRRCHDGLSFCGARHHFGRYYGELDIFAFLYSDVALAGIAIAVVIVIGTVATGSPVIMMAGVWEILVSVPLAMFMWTKICGQKVRNGFAGAFPVRLLEGSLSRVFARDHLQEFFFLIDICLVIMGSGRDLDHVHRCVRHHWHRL